MRRSLPGRRWQQRIPRFKIKKRSMTDRMNVAEFQKKLNGVLELARKNDNKVSAEKVEQYFKEEMLEKEQLESIFEYLAAEKVLVSDRADPLTADSSRNGQNIPGEGENGLPVWADPELSSEEKAYVEDYIRSLGAREELDERLKSELFEQAVAGDDLAKSRLVQWYLPIVAETAKRYHHPQVFIGDTIQEGNVSLLLAIEGITDPPAGEAYLEEAVCRGIREMVEEQTEQRRLDEAMVGKVEKLENAIKELTEEDGKIDFSVDELALFLDMSREEIEDILRLAGEDK